MKITGADRLKRKLARLPKVARDEIRTGLAKAAREIVDLMESLVPKGRTGALGGSIGWTWGEAPKGSIAVGSLKSGDLKITIYAGDETAYYARWVEFGTAPHVNGGLFAGSEHPGTTAQPFFYPSYRLGKKRAKSQITRAMNTAAKKVAAGG